MATKNHQSTTEIAEPTGSDMEVAPTSSEGSNSEAVDAAAGEAEKEDAKNKAAEFGVFKKRLEENFGSDLGTNAAGDAVTPKMLWDSLLAVAALADTTLKTPSNRHDNKPAYTDPAPDKRWVDMKHAGYILANSFFETVISDLLSQSTSKVAEFKAFGFWSGTVGYLAVKKSGCSALENTKAGKVFDKLGNLDGMGWDPALWGALSGTYATAVGEALLADKSKRINVFLGPWKREGNMWDSIESTALSEVFKNTGDTWESLTTYHSAYCSDAKAEVLDESYKVGGFAGVGHSSNDMKAAADDATKHAEAVQKRLDPGSENQQ